MRRFPPVLISASAAIFGAALVVAGGVFLSHSGSGGANSPPGPAAVRPLVAGSDIRSLSAYFAGSFDIPAAGLDLDARPPGSAPGDMIFYRAGLLTADTASIEFAVWPDSSTPTGGQCQVWITAHKRSSLSNVVPGMRVCVKTGQGRFGYLYIESADGNDQMSVTAMIWGA